MTGYQLDLHKSTQDACKKYPHLEGKLWDNYNFTSEEIDSGEDPEEECCFVEEYLREIIKKG